MNKQRMQELANFLKTVKDNKFSLSEFISTHGYDAVGDTKGQLKDVDCKTTACAVGWFPLVWPNVFAFENTEVIRKDNGHLNLPDKWTYSKKVSLNWLDLTVEEWDMLFLSSSYRYVSSEEARIAVINKLEGWVQP